MAAQELGNSERNLKRKGVKERGEGGGEGIGARGGRPREGHKGGVGGRQREHLKASTPSRLTVRPSYTSSDGGDDGGWSS